MAKRVVLGVLLAAGVTGCGGELDNGQSIVRLGEGLKGCKGKASSAIPASGDYYLTTFGDGASDDGIMSCGTYTRHGSWYYVASRQRYGCGAHLKIEAEGRCVIAKADDYGPDVCVENAVGGPIMDASPLVAEHLYGVSSAGWSDRLVVHVTEVDEATALGPCDGQAAKSPPAKTGAAACSSATLGRSVDSGVCIQAASDRQWYKCVDGKWTLGHTGCSVSYPWCSSATLGRSVPPMACVQSSDDGEWYQCGAGGWVQPVVDGVGPVGGCSTEYAL